MKGRGCPWRGSKEVFKEAHGLALSLFSMGDGYVQAAAEVIGYAKDGSSRKRVEMMEKALRCQAVIRTLFAFLDPEHYHEGVHN